MQKDRGTKRRVYANRLTPRKVSWRRWFHLMDHLSCLERREKSLPGGVMLYVLPLSCLYICSPYSTTHLCLFYSFPYHYLIHADRYSTTQQCFEGMPIHRSPVICENAVCNHRRCDVCYFLDFWYRVISHCDGSEVKDEEWLLWWCRYFRGSGRDERL